MKRIAAITLLITISCLPITASPDPLIGKKAKDFQLKDLAGEKHKLSTFRESKSAIVLFWASWCSICRATIPGLNKNAQDFEKKGIKVLLVNVGESEKEVRSYVQSNKIVLPVWLDKHSEVIERFSVVQVPTFVLLDQDGTIREITSHLPDNFEALLKPGSASTGS